MDAFKMTRDWTALGSDPEKLIRFGNEWRRRSRPDRAFGYFRRAYDLLPDHPRAIAELGRSEAELRRWGDAVTHLSDALRFAGEDPWVEEHRDELAEKLDEARRHLGSR
jgi:tetratricopeptide (TPR) repeat protein